MAEWSKIGDFYSRICYKHRKNLEQLLIPWGYINVLMTEMFVGWGITPKMSPAHSGTAQLLGAHSECSSSPLKLSLGLGTLPGPLCSVPHTPAVGSCLDSHLLSFRTRVSFQTRQTRRALWDRDGNKRGNELMSHSFIQCKNSWNWMFWTYHRAWRTIWARGSRETLFTLEKKCNSLIPSDSSAPSWEYSDYSPVPGNVCPGFSQMAKAKGFMFLPCSNLCWERDFVGQGKSLLESG